MPTLESKNIEVDDMILRSGYRVVNLRHKEHGKYAAVPSPEKLVQENANEPTWQPAQWEGKTSVNYNILAHLKCISALLSVYEDLMLSKDSRDAFVQAILNSKIYETFIAEKHLTEPITIGVDDVTFTDEDWMLGTEDHNRPLYMKDYINCFHVKRVLIDPLFVVNLLSFCPLNKLKRLKEDLEHENVTIEGFNKTSE